MNLLSEKNVSKYPTAQSKTNIKVSLTEELEKIRNGFYRTQILACRENLIQDIKLYKQLKTTLPAITFCGVFDGPHSKNALAIYNNIIIIDIDNVLEVNINSIKALLFSDPYVIACWISPSGRGLKLLIPIEADVILHKLYFDRIVDYLTAKYDVDIDTSGADVCRLCFVSYDEDLMLKNNAEKYPVDEDEWFIALLNNHGLEKKDKILNLPERKLELFDKTEKILFYKTEGKNKAINKELIRKIIAYLKRTNQSITKNYQDWLKVAFAISNSFTYDLGKKYYLEICRLDGVFHDEYKSENLLEYCYRKRKIDGINFGSIIYLASIKGFKNLHSL